MKKILLIFLFAVVTNYSQVTEEWTRIYNRNSADTPKQIKLDKEGNIYVLGESIGPTTGGDIVIIKYNSSGVELWVKIFTSSGYQSDYARDIAIDTLGNAYVLGSGYFSNTDMDFVTIKYSPQGVEEWVRYYNGPANLMDSPSKITIDNEGNPIVTGGSQSISNTDILTIKYNSNGTVLWTKLYNGIDNQSEAGVGVSSDKFGNVYVLGWSDSLGTGTIF